MELSRRKFLEMNFAFTMTPNIGIIFGKDDLIPSGIVNSRIELPLDEMINVEEIIQREGIFSTSESDKPILAAYGVFDCVAVVGYSNKLRRGFLTHFDSLTDRNLGNFNDPYWMPHSLTNTSYWGTKGVEDIANYDVRILHGGNNQKLLNAIEKHLLKLNSWHKDRMVFDVVERDVDYSGESKNIALDLRTGDVFTYDPKKNPYTRNLDPNLEKVLMFPSPLNWKIDDSLQTIPDVDKKI